MPPILTAWLCALRLPYFITTAIPLCIALMLVKKETGILPGLEFLILLAGILCVHGATNLINDYYDTINGVDTSETLGGSRVLFNDKLTLATIAKAAAFLYLLSLLFFILFSWQTGRWWVLPGWLAGFAASFFYVGPPVAYGYRGWGEVILFISFGWILLLGSYLALSGQFSITAFLLSTIFGLMSTEILFFQSLPEIETDPEHGKHTLASKLGKKKAVKIQQLSWPVIWGVCILLGLTGTIHWLIFGSLVGIPLYIMLNKRINHALELDNWPDLDSSGYLVKAMFLLTSIFLFLACASI